jgi:hypothetical protein
MRSWVYFRDDYQNLIGISCHVGFQPEISLISPARLFHSAFQPHIVLPLPEY